MINSRETSIELITAGLLALTFVLFLIGIFHESVAMLLGGIILLGSAVYQTSKGWHVSLVTWILGLILFLGGIGLRIYLVGNRLFQTVLFGPPKAVKSREAEKYLDSFKLTDARQK